MVLCPSQHGTGLVTLGQLEVFCGLAVEMVLPCCSETQQQVTYTQASYWLSLLTSSSQYPGQALVAETIRRHFISSSLTSHFTDNWDHRGHLQMHNPRNAAPFPRRKVDIPLFCFSVALGHSHIDQIHSYFPDFNANPISQFQPFCAKCLWFSAEKPTFNYLHSYRTTTINFFSVDIDSF